MTPKQMYRAMRKWGISVVFAKDTEEWCAGVGKMVGDRAHVDFSNTVHGYTHFHVASNPESAVEDYCNARNLEWDV